MRFAYSERRSYFRKDRYPKEGNGLFCCLRFFFFVPWGGFGPAFPLILLGFFSSLDRLSIPIDAEKSSEAILSKGICIWSQNSWSTRSSMEKLYGESNLCYDKRASPALLSFRGEISMGKKNETIAIGFCEKASISARMGGIGSASGCRKQSLMCAGTPSVPIWQNPG